MGDGISAMLQIQILALPDLDPCSSPPHLFLVPPGFYTLGPLQQCKAKEDQSLLKLISVQRWGGRVGRELNWVEEGSQQRQEWEDQWEDQEGGGISSNIVAQI